MWQKQEPNVKHYSRLSHMLLEASAEKNLYCSDMEAFKELLFTSMVKKK